MGMRDGMAREGIPDEIEQAIEDVLTQANVLSGLLNEHGYTCGTAMFDVAADEIRDAIEAEEEAEEEVTESREDPDERMERMMDPGYIYDLTHPTDEEGYHY